MRTFSIYSVTSDSRSKLVASIPEYTVEAVRDALLTLRDVVPYSETIPGWIMFSGELEIEEES